VVVASVGRGIRGAAPTLLAILAIALVASGFYAGYRWLRTSDRFAVKTIVVDGNQRATDDELIRLAAIADGANIFALSMSDVAERVRRSPWVDTAHAERRLPDGIAITVSERVPAAVVRAPALYLVDAQGRAFKRAAVEKGEADGLLVVSGLDRRLWAGGSEAGPALVRRALAAVARWNETPPETPRPAIGEVHFARTGMTLFTLERAVALKLGLTADDALAARFARFDAVWSALSDGERAAARAIHLDSETRPDRVTVRLANAGQ
jgi:cell division protein FtsQ